MSSSEPLHTVTVTTDPEAQVVIFDGYDHVRQRGIGTANWALPSGLYTVRAQLAGQQIQKMINVPETTSIILVPPIYSPAPIDGAATTHEYYHDPAHNWSNKSTIPTPTLGSGGWLFIFVRLSSEKSARDGDIVQGLSLRDSEGRLILDLTDRQLTQRNDASGWALVSTPINPGFYRIRFDGTESRESSLYVYPNFSTQIFITYFHWPRLEQMRAFLRPLGQPFEASDLETRSVEFALLGLQNGMSSLAETLPRSDQKALLDGKFVNPMLGLIGAHWLLEDSSSNWTFVNMALTNLKNLLGPVPDIVALEVAAAKRFEQLPQPGTPILTPPFIRHGLEILVKERPDLLPAGEFTESILENLCFDSPWTSWYTKSQFQPILRTRFPSTAPAEHSLDWLESAVLNAGLRGEFDLDKAESLATQFVVTAASVRNANSRLLAALQGQSLPVRFNETYLAEGQNPAAKLSIENWAARGAAVFNQPLPIGFTEVGGYISAEQDIAFRGSGADVYLKIGAGETPLVIGNWKSALLQIDRSFRDLRTLTPQIRRGTSSSFLISATYHQDTPRGAVALSSAGPRSAPQSPQLNVISAGARWRGLRDSIQLFLRDLGLPRQVAKAPEVSQQTLHFGHVEGSLRFKFDSHVGLALLGQAEGQEQWYASEVSHPLVASGTLTASGAFQFGFFRDPNGTIKFAIYGSARSEYAPIYLAEFDVGSFQWVEWLREAALQTQQSNEPVARKLTEMGGTFAMRIKERAFYHWLRNRTLQDDAWYQAERIEKEEVAAAFTRVLSRQYATSLKNLLDQSTSEMPLIEIQIEGAENIDLLEHAMDGSFDLRDQRPGVSLSGALVSIAGQRQTCPIFLGAGRPTVLVDDDDRLAAVDDSLDRPEMALARMQAAAAAAGVSGPSALSSPSATLTSVFLGATSGLLQLILSPLVQRWLPDRQKFWESFMSNIGTQAGKSQWNALIQLKLRWAIDIRKVGGDAALGPDLIRPILRRELRSLLPFFFFEGLNTLLNLRRTIPLFVYQLLPPDVSSVEKLETNFDLASKLTTFMLSLKRALKTIEIYPPDDRWNLPDWTQIAATSWSLKMLLAWEEHISQIVIQNLSQISRNPRARAAIFDWLALEIVNALSGLPILSDKPRAVNALRTVLFTTALSLMASAPANVSTELSITAFDSRMVPAPQWIDSPDSVPLAAIGAFGRLAAMAQSWSPVAVTARRAVAAY